MHQKQFDNMPLEPVPTTARCITGRPPALAFLVMYIQVCLYMHNEHIFQESHSNAASTPSPLPMHNVQPILKKGKRAMHAARTVRVEVVIPTNTGIHLTIPSDRLLTS
jgi:hypothetical protein